MRGFSPSSTDVQERARNASLFFDDVLYRKAKEINPKLEDTKEELVRKLTILQGSIQGNRDFLAYLKGENEPIGILLCAEKNKAVVKFTLPEGQKQIYISKYIAYLPTEDELKAEILREKELIEMEIKLGKDKK